MLKIIMGLLADWLPLKIESQSHTHLRTRVRAAHSNRMSFMSYSALFIDHVRCGLLQAAGNAILGS